MKIIEIVILVIMLLGVLIGLKKGDVIIEFSGKEVKSTAYFRYLLYKQKVGDTVKIKYFRDGKIKEASIILDESAS